MKILTGIAALALVIAAVMWGSTDSRGQECRPGGRHNITVHPNPEGMPSLSYNRGDPQNVHVCRGDRVQWVLAGSAPDRDFFIDFASSVGAPFDGPVRQPASGRVVRVVISDSATSRDYKYNVEVVGDPILDPRIIVD